MPDVLHGDFLAILFFSLGLIAGGILLASPRGFFSMLFMPRIVLNTIGPKITTIYRGIGLLAVISCGYAVIAALLGKL